MTYDIEERRLTPSSSKSKTFVSVPAFVEHLLKVVDTTSNEGSEFTLSEGLEMEKLILDAYDYIGVFAESPDTKKGIVSRSKLLRHSLEPTVATLQALTKMLEKELGDAHRIEEQVISMCGFASLPTEILEKIFHIAVHGEEGRIPSVAITLSHVCRFFRDMVLNSPSFWTTIDVSYADAERPLSQAILELCLERSKQSPLGIRIKFDDYDVVSPRNAWNRRYLAILARHAHRWRSFDIELFEIHSRDYFNLFRDIPHLHLPDLQRFAIRSTFPWSYRILERSFIFSTWNAPKLRELRVSNHLPFSVEASTTFDSVEQAEIRFDTIGVWNPDRYLNALLRLSSLSQLDLIIHNTVPFDLEANISSVSLKSVQIYRVELHSIKNPNIIYETAISTLSGVLGALRCPNALQLSLVVTECSGQFVAPLLSALSEHHYPSLVDLSLSISPSCRTFGASTDFNLPLEAAPNLRHLSMSIASDFDISLSRRVSSKPLKTLRFANPYPKSVARWLRSFIGWTSEAKNWPLFETFIFECSPTKVLSRKGEERMTEAPSSTKVIESEDIASWCREILNPYSKMIVAGSTPGLHASSATARYLREE
ncbi:hypothetical protein SCHPADRAFT_120124 [Schizopora paradoxa]|uniref:Uncharacterized protein n=1 Tax=Schizopora paradoxa TaxID=27342 RepID=A0A0H2S3D7_9AGAM|nr:hypothetical protein SCHPADRAFT_120124 [Schizopora paradoxa]